ncbi:hypothetical protein A5893_02500 [Pedobacter psychrophilus]|uniref:HAD family hydrolase n=1 Tax=Pedobacter psychrophilus TaxID=1826909 RepID=A0A179DM76_9SPHI|nr:HAD family phosphatase [Pedobacter psychrophilus]OAQ42008.1 hypothetical protein A5893_02500 [Pedobacter psychrophilus]
MNILQTIRKFKAVIFDMDGTLVDNIPFHKKAWLQFLHAYQISIPEAEFDAQNHGTGPEMVKKFFGNHLSNRELNDLWKVKEETYRELYTRKLKPINGLNSFLKSLKKENIRIALATMGTKENIDLVLDGLDIRDYFEVIVAGDEVSKGKPHPEVYSKAAEMLDLKTMHCIAIEDSMSGIRSAAAAGMEVIAITTSSSENYFKNIGLRYIIKDFL